MVKRNGCKSCHLNLTEAAPVTKALQNSHTHTRTHAKAVTHRWYSNAFSRLPLPVIFRGLREKSLRGFAGNLADRVVVHVQAMSGGRSRKWKFYKNLKFFLENFLLLWKGRGCLRSWKTVTATPFVCGTLWLPVARCTFKPENITHHF